MCVREWCTNITGYMVYKHALVFPRALLRRVLSTFAPIDDNDNDEAQTIKIPVNCWLVLFVIDNEEDYGDNDGDNDIDENDTKKNKFNERARIAQLRVVVTQCVTSWRSKTYKRK